MNKMFLAALGFVLTLCAPAFANQSWEDVSLQTALAATDGATHAQGLTTTSVISRADRSLVPSVGAPAVMAISITTGLNQTGVPCLSCVPGAQTSANVGLTQPLAYIPTAIASLQYAFFYQSVSVTGHCTISLVVSAGKTILFKATAPLNLTAGDWRLTASGAARPTYSGPALLVGKVACPAVPAGIVKESLYFQ